MELERERRVGESLGGGTGEVEDLKKRLEDASQELTVVLRRGDCEKVPQLRFATLPDLRGIPPKERVAAEAAGMWLERVTDRDKLVHVRIPSPCHSL